MLVLVVAIVAVCLAVGPIAGCAALVANAARDRRNAARDEQSTHELVALVGIVGLTVALPLAFAIAAVGVVWIAMLFIPLYG